MSSITETSNIIIEEEAGAIEKEVVKANGSMFIKTSRMISAALLKSSAGVRL